MSKSNDRRFLFLLASSRRNGNSEILAKHAASYLAPDVTQSWIRLLDHPLPPFKDIRHVGSGTYPYPVGSAAELLNATLDATDLVFVAPLYWYSVPALAKNYLDHWSGWMRVPKLNFLERMAGKKIWAVTALSEEDFSAADPLLGTLKLTANYANMQWGGELLGYANRPGEILKDTASLARSVTFFRST